MDVLNASILTLVIAALLVVFIVGWLMAPWLVLFALIMLLVALLLRISEWSLRFKTIDAVSLIHSVDEADGHTEDASLDALQVLYRGAKCDLRSPLTPPSPPPAQTAPPQLTYRGAKCRSNAAAGQVVTYQGQYRGHASTIVATHVQSIAADPMSVAPPSDRALHHSPDTPDLDASGEPKTK